MGNIKKLDRPLTVQEQEGYIKNLTAKEKLCLYGYMRTKDRVLAYICSRETSPTTKKNSLDQLAFRWFNLPKVQAFLTLEQARTQTAAAIELGDNPEVSKDQLVRQLEVLFIAEKDPKLKAEIGMKLADLQGFKKETVVRQEDEQIHYYLPLKCSNCVLYKEAEKKPNLK